MQDYDQRVWLTGVSLSQMVLDAGRLVEFDTPRALLQNRKGLLYALVEQSADRDMLYKVANAA